MKKLNSISKEWIILLVFALIKLTIHLLTSTNYELHRDALLYYSLGENLDWGYVSVPPFIAIISKLSSTLFGHSVFALRFFPAVVGSLSVIVIGKMVKELNGGRLAIIIAVVAFILSPAFLRSNTLLQPVSFNQFFWLLSGYLFLKLLKTNDSRIWYIIFIVWGIAFLTKYSIAFFIISALLALMISQHRKMIISKNFFIGGALGTLIILPNLIWQYQHNWPVIHHMAELQKNQLVHVSSLWFMVDQLLMNLPGIAVWISGLLVFLISKHEKKYRFFGYVYLLTLAMLLLLRGKSYYSLGLYPVLFALGGYAIDKYYKTTYKYLILIIAVLLSLPLIPFSLPILSHEKMAEYSKPVSKFTNRWEDGKIHKIPQDYADMTGWKDVSTEIIRFYSNLPENERKNCLVFTENYGQAGAVKFYGKKYKIPEPISFSDNFLLWAPDSVNNPNLIYVNDDVGEIKLLYNSYIQVGRISNKYFREDGLKIFYFTNPKSYLNQFYALRVKKLKDQYKR